MLRSFDGVKPAVHEDADVDPRRSSAASDSGD